MEESSEVNANETNEPVGSTDAIVAAATSFTKANLELILCQQYEFKALCHRCWRYSACLVYEEWEKRWNDLVTLVGPNEFDMAILKNKYTR